MQNLFSSFFIKLLFSILLILAPAKGLFITCIILIFCDLLTGIWKAYYNKEKITSRKMSNTISKLVLYQVCILASFLIETQVLDFMNLPISKIVAGFLTLTELKSMSENISVILKIDVFKKVKNLLNREKEDVL